MKWIGLTGGMGTGKSTVASMIQSFGYKVLNADKNAHEALQKNSPVFPKIIQVFGTGILGPDGEIDRRKLGQIVFSDKYSLAKLEGMTHPFIQDRTTEDREKLIKSGIDMAFYDVPLLFEKKLQKNFDKIVLVGCRQALQIERSVKRTGLTAEDVKKRLANQMSLESKVKAAHYLIRNDGSLEELKMKVQDVLLALKKDLKLV